MTQFPKVALYILIGVVVFFLGPMLLMPTQTVNVLTSLSTGGLFGNPTSTPAIRPIEQATRATEALNYSFSSKGTLQEAPTLKESSSPYFWLNSGGELKIEEGLGKTQRGALSFSNRWRVRYASANSLDTDGGRFPQNIFRLLTKTSWENNEQTVAFKIVGVNMTDTPNRGEWSGVLLMSRYLDEDNLYYAGLRQDGHAVIKKKIGGVYHTLVEKPIFSSDATYERSAVPNLIPGGTWMGMRVTTTNTQSGVRVDLSLDRENDGSFQSLLSTEDQGVGGAPLRDAGLNGIRGDFFDLEFDSYTIKPL
jgi:hypothetical protein